ncbi:MAG TPA: beta-ketoacyl synthase N-terminal-like domain-containing protein [Gammaproteobacteria bacterium]|nr:beta-ketoacyl synthase N-terminal-like domain-containing protein [Gammaproteobacteria bacterium]
MIRVVSASHYLQPLHDEEPLPKLDDALRELCREDFRRTDRFIQLALLGSARCATGYGLQATCGVYLGSGLGPIGNNIVTQQQLIRDREIPKPFNFINTLGTSAGFYIARNLGLRGQNIFISRRSASLEAVLSIAIADLMLGAVGQALVGVVEEATLPLAAHRQRQGLVEALPLSEGSHWLLLEAGDTGGRQIQLMRFADYAALEGFLKPLRGSGARLYCTRGMETRFAENLRQMFPDNARQNPTVAFHDSLEAAWLTQFLTAGGLDKLFMVSGDNVRGWTLFQFSA